MATRSHSGKCWVACKREYAATFFRLGEVFLAFGSGVMMLVTFGTPYWVEQSFPVSRGSGGGVEEAAMFHSGLWQNCTPSQGCQSIGISAPSECACVCICVHRPT